MYISEVGDIKLSLTGREAIDIAIYVKYQIERSAKEHHLKWYLDKNNNHSKEGFISYVTKEEGFYVDVVQKLSCVGGAPQFYDDLLYKLEEIYKETF